uniref:Uncharacterized protein n=1 Tax=Aegilops tauschii subsp. strangulata TaxID=200361 RepID=A0A453P823_AEGTS
SFYHILRRTLVERGVLGLYGGLASKIACSAPISAIYTLTYEIVKGSLLPTLPKVTTIPLLIVLRVVVLVLQHPLFLHQANA